MSLIERLPSLAELSLGCEMKRLATQLSRVGAPERGAPTFNWRRLMPLRSRVALGAGVWTRIARGDASRVFLWVSVNPLVTANFAWPPLASPVVVEGFQTSAQEPTLSLTRATHGPLPGYEWHCFVAGPGGTALVVELGEY